jgi:hypothetical protein
VAWYDEHYPGVNVEFRQIGETEYQVVDIVDDLPKHGTLTYDTRPLSDITALTIPSARRTDQLSR